MAPRLTSALANPPNRQFAHFGVLDSGGQSKSSMFTSVTVNIILMIIALIIGAASKKVIDNRVKTVAYVVPLKEKPPEPIKPKVIPPKIVPPKPVIKPPEPKIVLPKVTVIEPPKVQPVTPVPPKPLPVMVAAPPKVVVAAAAPKAVNVNLAAKSASVPNNDPHPTAVRLGAPDSPISNLHGPAVAKVNMASGFAGMPPGNTGGGPASKTVNLGNGSPDGKIGGGGVVAAKGVKIGGCLGCDGKGPGNATGNSPRAVAIAPPAPPAAAAPSQARSTAVRQNPTVLYKPKPAYTAEATSLHLEGTVTVKIHVSASGAVSVIGVTSGLGHGLDESAVRAAQGIRFKPAMDASGSPVDWEGNVSIIFQMA